MANQPTKLTTEKLVDVLSHENVHNIPHLLQFLSFQVVLLLQVNFALSVAILFVCVMPTKHTIVKISHTMMSATSMLLAVAS